MKKSIYHIVLTVGFLIIQNSETYAQNVSLQQYNFNNVAQSTMLNPATKVQSNVTIGLVGLGMQLNLPHINLADIFTKGQSVTQTIDGFLTSTDKSLKNINFELQTGMFVGFRILKKNYFSLGAYADMRLHASIPKDPLNLLWNGTAPYLNKTLDIAPQVYANLNLVYHLGYSRQINDQLTIGARVKLISGVQNIMTTQNQLNLEIRSNDTNNNNTYRYLLKSNYAISFNNASLVGKSIDFASLLFANGINGFGLDFGINYKINEKWSVSASVLDIGSITWNNDVITLQKRGINNSYEGLVFNDISSIRNGNGIGTKLDSIVKNIGFDTIKKAYQTSLPSKFYIGGEYALRPTTKINANFFGYFSPINGIFDYAFGISASQKFWSILDLKLGWNIYNHDPANLSLGFSLNLGYFQVYAMTENIIAAFRYDQANRFNLQLGVNFNFGLNLDKDGDGVVNKEDKCVKIFGLAKFEGCPDTDKDSVPDNKDSCRLDSGTVANKGCPMTDKDLDSVFDALDSCPDIKGLKWLNGCPDMDNDSVPDYQDSCKDVKGSIYAMGCPDADGDSFADKKDSCKLQAGRPEYFGCPTKEDLEKSRFDADNDGTPDSVDRCLGLAGSVLLDGCPDYDSDGVADDQDSCMEIAGELGFNGCPDTDSDKIPDYLDQCITLFGSASNKGCPINIPGLSSRKKAGKKTPTGNALEETQNEQSEEDNSLIKGLALTKQQSNVLVQAFKNLNFKFQSATILESSYPVLDDLAHLLKNHASSRLVLIGYTDNVGDEAFNQSLSYQRASSIKTYLVEKGVENKIELYGFGENNPVADNNTANGRSKNRRVEMAILE